MKKNSVCPFQEDSYWNGTRILKHSGNNIHHDCHCSFDEVKHDDAKVAEKTEDEDLFPGDLVVTVVTADHHHVTMFRKLHQFDPGSVLVLDSRYRIGSIIDQEKTYFADLCSSHGTLVAPPTVRTDQDCKGCS